MQFDVPIGSFQAIQHKLADMSPRRRAGLERGVLRGDDDRRGRRRPPSRGPRRQGRGRRGRDARAAKDGIQIHGGIGYTWEHDLHLFMRRAFGSEHCSAPPTGTTTGSPTC